MIDDFIAAFGEEFVRVDNGLNEQPPIFSGWIVHQADDTVEEPLMYIDRHQKYLYIPLKLEDGQRIKRKADDSIWMVKNVSDSQRSFRDLEGANTAVSVYRHVIEKIKVDEQ